MLACAFGKSGGDSFRIGYVAGLSFWLASLYWLLLMPVAGFPILGWVALSAYLALYPAVWVWLLAGKIGEGDWARRNLWSLARRGGLGCARNDSRAAVRRLSVEFSRRVAIPDDSAHPDCVRHRRLWRFISRRVGFALALFRRADDFSPARDCASSGRRKFSCRSPSSSFCSPSVSRKWAEKIPPAPTLRVTLDPAQRPANLDLGRKRKHQPLPAIAPIKRISFDRTK